MVPIESVREMAVAIARAWLAAATGQDAALGPVKIRIEAGGTQVAETAGPVKALPAVPMMPAGDSVPVAMYSPDEAAILNALRGGPIPLKSLCTRAAIERTRTGLLCSNLRARGAITVTDDGYALITGRQE